MHSCVVAATFSALTPVQTRSLQPGDAFPSSLKHIMLAFPAGFSDPVYAEAYVTVHQYDIVLDVTVINRTTETLQNLCLELATMGDLKLVERPQNYTLGPAAQKSIRSVISACSLARLLTRAFTQSSASVMLVAFIVKGGVWRWACVCCLQLRSMHDQAVLVMTLYLRKCMCFLCLHTILNHRSTALTSTGA